MHIHSCDFITCAGVRMGGTFQYVCDPATTFRSLAEESKATNATLAVCLAAYLAARRLR